MEKLEEFLDLPNQERDEMGRQGRLKMEREFDRNIIVKHYLDEINKAG